jgi:hypothetical protein
MITEATEDHVWSRTWLGHVLDNRGLKDIMNILDILNILDIYDIYDIYATI